MGRKKKLEERYFYSSCKELTHISCKFEGIILITVKVCIYPIVILGSEL